MPHSCPPELEKLIVSIEHSPIPATVTDSTRPDDPLVGVNAAFCALTGYDRVDCIGRNCRFLGGPLTEAYARRTLRDAIAAGRPAMTRITNYRKDGALFLNAVMIAPVSDAQGTVVGFVGSQLDVSSHAKMDETEWSSSTQQRLSNLTRRQIQVLDYMTRGLVNKQIADRLQVSEKTVKFHRALVIDRLAVRNSVEAIRLGIEAGLGTDLPNQEA